MLISGYEDGAIAHEAITRAAAGFLSKESEEAEIAAAIIEVANGVLRALARAAVGAARSDL